MRERLTYILALLLSLTSGKVLADTLVERFGDSYSGLPEYLEFDCTDPSAGRVEALGRYLRIPNNFERPRK